MTILLPSSDISNANWGAAGRADLWDCLDEALASPDDDATYISTATQGAVCVVGLASGPAAAVGAVHTVSFRARAASGPHLVLPSLTVELLETATQRGTATVSLQAPAPYTWTTYSFTATGITAYSDLRLRFTCSALTVTGRMRVTAAQLEYAVPVPRSQRAILTQPGVESGIVITGRMQRGGLTPCV